MEAVAAGCDSACVLIFLLVLENYWFWSFVGLEGHDGGIHCSAVVEPDFTMVAHYWTMATMDVNPLFKPFYH